jgi:hypothetical protein
LSYGHIDAAHMVAPLAIATALGRGRPAEDIAVPFVLGLNGNAITFSTELAQATLDGDELGDPVEVGRSLRAVVEARGQRRLRFGVVHRYSSHNYMLRYWLAAVGIRPDADVEIVTTHRACKISTAGTTSYSLRRVTSTLGLSPPQQIAHGIIDTTSKVANLRAATGSVIVGETMSCHRQKVRRRGAVEQCAINAPDA